MSKNNSISDVIYEIIRTPVITEKATLLGSQNKVTFKVAIDADKKAIKKAVEKLFNVKVSGVNTIKSIGKVKRFRGKIGSRNASKKAIVSLAEGQSIDIMAGLK